MLLYYQSKIDEKLTFPVFPLRQTRANLNWSVVERPGYRRLSINRLLLIFKLYF